MKLTLTHRDGLGLQLNSLKLLGEFVEVGCLRGNFAATVLSQWKGKRYHMIDPWDTQSGDVFLERQPTKEEHQSHYQECLGLAENDKRVNVIRGLSPDAASEFQPNKLDCVYLDGNHSYRAVMEDMDAWWPKIKIGGIMGGHDFLEKTDEGWWCEVSRAVLRWTGEHGKTFLVCPCTSWFIHKQSP